jgi:hypothetical protein
MTTRQPPRLAPAASPVDLLRRLNLADSPILSASPVPGVGGLGLLALAVLVALARPQMVWLLLASAVGGVLLSGVLIGRARRRPLRPIPRAGRSLMN